MHVRFIDQWPQAVALLAEPQNAPRALKLLAMMVYVSSRTVRPGVHGSLRVFKTVQHPINNTNGEQPWLIVQHCERGSLGSTPLTTPMIVPHCERGSLARSSTLLFTGRVATL